MDNVYTAGILMSKKERLSKSGQKFAFATFSDTDGAYEVGFMPETYTKIRDKLSVGQAYLLKIQLKVDGDRNKINVYEIQSLDAILENQNIFINIDNNTDIKGLKKYLESLPDGNNKIFFITKNQYGQKLEINSGLSKSIRTEEKLKIFKF